MMTGDTKVRAGGQELPHLDVERAQALQGIPEGPRPLTFRGKWIPVGPPADPPARLTCQELAENAGHLVDPLALHDRSLLPGRKAPGPNELHDRPTV